MYELVLKELKDLRENINELLNKEIFKYKELIPLRHRPGFVEYVDFGDDSNVKGLDLALEEVDKKIKEIEIKIKVTKKQIEELKKMKITELDILYTKIERFINPKEPEIIEPGVYDIVLCEDTQEIAFNDLKVFIYNNKISEKYPELVKLIQKLVDKKIELQDKDIFWLKDEEFLKIMDKVFAIIEEKNKKIKGEE